MRAKLRLEILQQPDDTTCGPTCLHAVYRYWGDEVSLGEVISSVGRLPEGGTLAVILARHALQRGYRVTLYTYNLEVFDPTWFADSGRDLADRLRRQLEIKHSRRLRTAMRAYLRFLELGGTVRLADLSEGLIRQYLEKSAPILTGLSATFLYRAAREHGPDCVSDDIRGEPVGHFVVVCGYHAKQRTVDVADPYYPNPLSDSQYYEVDVDRLISAILLGTLTYDGNLLVVEPG